MRLTKLVLENFQSIKSFVMDLSADGKNAIVMGANGTGKTTVGNAVTWLLTGKPINGQKSYSPKRVDANGDEMHNVNNTAEAEFLMDDGSTLKLKKDYHEKYQTKSGMKTFVGNETSYWIDDKPVTETAYENSLRKLFGSDDRAKMLTNPSYFAVDMDWKDRRSLLIDMVGNVSDSDVIASDPALSPLSTLAAGTSSIQDYKVQTEIRLKKAKEALAEIKPRIDEAGKAIPDIPEGADDNELASDLEKLKKEEDENKEKIASLEDSELLSEIRRRVSELKATYSEKRVAFTLEMDEKNKPVLEEIETLRQEKASLLSQTEMAKRMLDESLATKTRLENDITALRDQYKEIKASSYIYGPEPVIDEICPTCGQPIPKEKIKEAEDACWAEEERKRQEWEKAKQNSLDEITRKGSENKEKVAGLTDKIEKIKPSIEAGSNRIKEIEERLDTLKKKVCTSKFENSDAAMKIQENIAALEKNLESGAETKSAAENAIRARLAEIENEKKRISTIRSNILIRKAQEKRIADLAVQEKDLNDEITKLKGYIELADTFITKKASMLNSKIGGLFKNVKFRMFEVQQNNGIRDVCKPLVRCSSGWIAYEQASTAEKINGGLEIINVLAEYFGFSLPIVIDNAEAVNEMVPTKSQQIRLLVDTSKSLAYKTI